MLRLCVAGPWVWGTGVLVCRDYLVKARIVNRDEASFSSPVSAISYWNGVKRGAAWGKAERDERRRNEDTQHELLW